MVLKKIYINQIKKNISDLQITIVGDKLFILDSIWISEVLNILTEFKIISSN